MPICHPHQSRASSRGNTRGVNVLSLINGSKAHVGCIINNSYKISIENHARIIDEDGDDYKGEGIYPLNTDTEILKYGEQRDRPFAVHTLNYECIKIGNKKIQFWVKTIPLHLGSTVARLKPKVLTVLKTSSEACY